METLISLVITAMLLAAVAGSFVSSSAAVETNDQFFRATQAARLAINQMVNDVRQCQSGTYAPTQINLVTASAQQRTYQYDAPSQQLQLTLPGQDPPPVYTLAHNVSSVSFNSDGSSVAIVLTVKIGNNQVTLCGSAFPRRLMNYN